MEQNQFLRYYTEFIFVEDQPEPSDLIFVPGGAYPEIAERAAELWKAGYAACVLPSGRYSILNGGFAGPASMQETYPGDFSTEWELLSHVLWKNGVPEQAILKEDQASYTYENAIYSRAVTDAAGISVRQAIICCQAYHGRRALLYYQLLYPEARLLVCPAVTRGISRDNWYRTTLGAELVLGEMERCGSQFHEIFRRFSDTSEKNIGNNGKGS